jgi:hypothetical protein
MDPVDRREFHRWSLAAMAGLAAGFPVGCGGGAPAPTPTPAASGATPTLTDAEQLILDEPHVCRGLNSCKGLGRSKENACAGQGTCASVAEHACASQNECKGQGGCGADPGMNACKGQGSCHVPLMDEIWAKARGAFEGAMKKTGKTVGAAPEKAPS